MKNVQKLFKLNISQIGMPKTSETSLYRDIGNT